jgi:uncharacterized protein (TIGR02300 family)
MSTEALVAKPELGLKRVCPNCGARYYDLNRDPIACPKCGSPYDPEALLKTRRSRAPAAAEQEVDPVNGDETEAEGVEGEDGLPLEKADDEEEELIEDASELGEDEDDMAAVIENVDDEEER